MNLSVSCRTPTKMPTETEQAIEYEIYRICWNSIFSFRKDLVGSSSVPIVQNSFNVGLSLHSAASHACTATWLTLQATSKSKGIIGVDYNAMQLWVAIVEPHEVIGDTTG